MCEDIFMIVGLLSYFDSIYTILRELKRELMSFITIILGFISRILMRVIFFATSLLGYIICALSPSVE